VDSQNTKSYRLKVIALLTACTFINSLDRASLSVAVPFIIKDFGITKTAMGVALSSFFWTYVIGNVISGYMSDRFGVKKVLGWSCAIWSIFSALTGAAQNVFHIMMARMGVGLGEAAVLPSNTKIVASNFPSSERGMAIGTFAMGLRLGNAVTPMLMAFLIVQYGWRGAFVITGLGSLLWCAFWYFGFRDLSEEQAKAKGEAKPKINWKAIFTSRALCGIAIVKFTQDFLQWMFMTWVPAYLIMDRHLSVAEMGFYTSLSYAVAVVAQPAFGYLSDWLIKQGWTPSKARKTIQVALQLMSATIILVGYIYNLPAAMFFLVLAISAESVAAGHMWTVISELVPSKLLGSVGGGINAIGSMAGIISPILTGMIVEWTGNFQLALFFGGGMLIIAALVTIFVVPELKPLESLGGNSVEATEQKA